ncbi:GLPGLI family protein [Carboxylicivirga sp. N1Y90]|uniref:GLPGLI family protein n=1 Tax=Carboxylicivirga fragile TaxID=3417571 RepID=UPI003D32C8D3|nr:GLPGLI family protein [Marinilabiliaceae bacterium N1Y90]
MSKLMPLFLISFIGNYFSCNSQNLTVLDTSIYFCQYNYVVQVDSTDVAIKQATVMNLYIGNGISKYEHSSNFRKDSLLKVHSKEDPTTAALKILPSLMNNRSNFFTKYQVIKTKTNKVVLKEQIEKTFYQVEMDTALSWQLIDRDTTILGLNCKMARTDYKGRNYKAYYTTDIPIGDGPYIFKGLPGLIISITDAHKEHTFELITFLPNSYKRPIYDYNIVYKSITSQQYIKAKEVSLNSQIEKYTSSSMTQDPNIALRMRFHMMKHNNFIERFQ